MSVALDQLAEQRRRARVVSGGVRQAEQAEQRVRPGVVVGHQAQIASADVSQRVGGSTRSRRAGAELGAACGVELGEATPGLALDAGTGLVDVGASTTGTRGAPTEQRLAGHEAGLGGRGPRPQRLRRRCAQLTTRAQVERFRRQRLGRGQGVSRREGQAVSVAGIGGRGEAIEGPLDLGLDRHRHALGSADLIVDLGRHQTAVLAIRDSPEVGDAGGGQEHRGDRHHADERAPCPLGHAPRV